jgi:hypothetical protein
MCEVDGSRARRRLSSLPNMMRQSLRSIRARPLMLDACTDFARPYLRRKSVTPYHCSLSTELSLAQSMGPPK